MASTSPEAATTATLVAMGIPGPDPNIPPGRSPDDEPINVPPGPDPQPYPVDDPPYPGNPGPDIVPDDQPERRPVFRG